MSAPADKNTLVENAELYNAVFSFLKAETNFPNSARVQQVMDVAGVTKNADELFRAPITYAAFDADAALRWLSFVARMAAIEVEGVEVTFSRAFDANSAVAYLHEAYDIVTTALDAHYDDDSDDEDDADDE